ncbi:hypothetical protein M0D21_09950 [Aquimarina sp. D1M17]|uniref:hypothetical protein n=1 Tax=Aquimarina acroporae TaxID=2937283 RepID=UPI0020BF6E7E|nr:hypothetical protein [Aquimarina acroporae]MCK8521890.1 hypothetical protein [Aquimarina acroporae]
MKKNAIAFLSFLFLSTTFFLSCQDDDNDQMIPTAQVTTEKQYDDIETANNRIQSTVENTFNLESGFPVNRQLLSKNSDCITTTSEVIENTRTITIDFGDGCEVANGEIITGTITMSFSILMDTENQVEITYTVENFTYKEISVNGSATTTVSIDRDAGNRKFTTTSNFVFTWGDGLSATSETNFTKETFLETNADNPGDFDYYSLTSGSSNTTFSNGDIYSVEITTPLRNERGCIYIVSGVIITSQNSDTVTLDYGDGECDNIATQTDSDGNETTIEL